jgi:hypothetical protein
MGVSLNGVKKAFASAAVTAKGMFGSIKAGLDFYRNRCVCSP